MASREIFLNLQDDVNAIPRIKDAAVFKALLHSVIEHIIQLKHFEYRLVVIVRQAVNIARIMFLNTEGQTWVLEDPHTMLLSSFERIALVDIDNFVRRNTRHRFRNILKRIFFPDQDPIYPEYFALNERLVALSQSLQARCEDATGNEPPGGPSSHNHITSFFAGASNILVQHSTFVQAQGDFVLQERAESQGFLEGLAVIAREDITPIREVYRGRDHKLHVARIVSGRVVTIKVYEDRNAKEIFIQTGKIYQKSLGPDVLHLVAVSSSNSWLPFFVFDGVYEGTAVAAIGLALEKSLKESLMMGMETVTALSSGLEHLQIIGYPFAYAGEEHFSLLRNTDGRVMISFEAPSTTVTTPAGFDQQNEETVAFHAPLKMFHTLCRKTFDDACKAHYESQRVRRTYDLDRPYKDYFEETDETEQAIDDSPSSGDALRQPSSLSDFEFSSTKSSNYGKRTGSRRELVWNSTSDAKFTLGDVSAHYRNILANQGSSMELSLNRYRGSRVFPTAHWCPDYKRVDINLGIDNAHCAIVFHVSPNPNEICTVCKQVVREPERHKCICGREATDALEDTVRCSTCTTRYHRSCIVFSDTENFECINCRTGVSSSTSVMSDLLLSDCDDSFVVSVFPEAAPSVYRSISLSAPNWRSGIDGFITDASGAPKSLYIDGTRLKANYVRERVLVLLDIADQKLGCTSLVVVVKRPSPNVAEILHSLLYVGATIITDPPFMLNPEFVLVELEV